MGCNNNVLISGTPRSGTTLTCHLLNKLPDTVALHEPMNVKAFASLAGHDQIADAVERFCGEQRQSILSRGVAISKQAGGKVPDNPIETTRSTERLRRSVVSRGEIVVAKPLSPAFSLVIKHNASFAAALGALVRRFPVYAVIRNPLATLASW
ncbi:MAG: sulfotransferase, partial [Chloroflexota bacterium]|nr:sulfotransferase [Chloroflexota bacterium]